MSDFEYNCDTYPSFGKKYNGEKAIISLTSWRARINTVSKTIYSLLKQCPGFHIVLVLSEEEFPKMMDELPDNLKLFVDNELIEILFISPDYKVFMKTFFTMEKYKNVPVISADDDCIYTCNYAEILYNEWYNHKDCIISNDCPIFKKYIVARGQNTILFYPIMKNAIYKLKKLFNSEYKEKIINHPEDDAYNAAYYFLNNIKVIDVMKPQFYFYTKEQTANSALSKRISYYKDKSVNFFIELINQIK